MKNQARKPRLWPQFQGALTPAQIAVGLEAAQQNAIRLLEDARVLLELRRYPSAAFMAVIAIEEWGKLPILDSMAYTSPAKVKERWKAYRSHRSKNGRWVLPGFVDSGPKSIEEIASVAASNSMHTQFLDEVKQLCLYTECLGSDSWSEPGRFVTEKMVRGLIQDAERMIRYKPVSVEFIELEAKHLLPVADGPPEQYKQALEAFFDEAREKGLTSMSKETVKEMLHGKVDLAGAGRE